MEEIFLRAPINGNAARVTSQGGCSNDIDLTAQDLNDAREYYLKRRREIAKELGLDTKAKKRNIMYRANSKKNYIKNHPRGELVKEYVFMGKQSAKICEHLNKLKESK